MSKTNTSSSGISFCGLLFITLLVLKLTHYIDWSWWWVSAPLWAPFAIVGMSIILYAIIGTAVEVYKDYKRLK